MHWSYTRPTARCCTGALQAAEERLAALATRAVGTVQRCNVAHRRVDLYAMLGTGERAVAVGLECLRHMGIDWSAHPTDEETRKRIRTLLVPAWKSRNRGYR